MPQIVSMSSMTIQLGADARASSNVDRKTCCPSPRFLHHAITVISNTVPQVSALKIARQ